MMDATAKPKNRRKSEAARRLLAAVDRLILAARQAEAARRELARQTEGREGGARA
jgi:hypothetical protein